MQQKHQSALDETQRLTLGLNAQNRELRVKLSALELENSSLKAAAQNAPNAATLEKQTQALNAKLADAEKEINRLYEELASKVEGRNETLVRLEKENNLLASEIAGLKDELGASPALEAVELDDATDG